MNERVPAGFLKALRRLVRQVGLYPEGHPLTDEALQAMIDASGDLLTDGGAVISIVDNAFYHDRAILPHTSLEYHGLMREMQGRGLESITLESPVSPSDLTDLASFIGNVSGDLPADGTVRLNEAFLRPEDVTTVPLSGLRESYRGSLDALRFVTGTMSSSGTLELGPVVSAVEGLFESTVSHANAALLLSTVKSHDEYTFFHSVNTCILALAIGRIVGIDRSMLVPIGVGAVLHDIGKVAVSTQVLNYPGRLDDAQWKEITLHPQEGALAILVAGGVGHEIAATVAFEHHARFDGLGYPSITRMRRPHLFSRLVTVADTYDAVTTRRAYRRAETPSQALDILLGSAGTHYDPDMVDVFVRMMGIYPPGTIVQLITGELVVVTGSSDNGSLPGLLVRNRQGDEVTPGKFEFDPRSVMRQLLPEVAGVDPAALIEHVA